WLQVLVIELVYRSQIDRERVDPVLIAAENFVKIVIEGGEAADIVPYLLVGGVEDMGTILVVFDAGHRVGGGVTVAPDMVALFDNEHGLIQLVSDTLGGNSSQ